MSMIGPGAELPMRAHSLQMENRERLRLTGVSDVSGFDENLIALSTDMGELLIRGEELHIDKIDLDAGVMELRGRICEICYEERVSGTGLWKKLFG
ncbi:MAG: sporulation protein YabP [Oscillospiraceae bacterium]|nr:sporulation protein YabP [Oscillospiraceae bacterium]